MADNGFQQGTIRTIRGRACERFKALSIQHTPHLIGKLNPAAVTERVSASRLEFRIIRIGHKKGLILGSHEGQKM